MSSAVAFFWNSLGEETDDGKSLPSEDSIPANVKMFLQYVVDLLASHGTKPKVSWRPQKTTMQDDAWTCGWRVCALAMLILQEVRYNKLYKILWHVWDLW